MVRQFHARHFSAPVHCPSFIWHALDETVKICVSLAAFAQRSRCFDCQEQI